MTFLLDTNVVSELRKQKPDSAVASWSQNQDFSRAYLSVITIREIEFGVLRKELQDPVQGVALRTWLERIIDQDYADRITSNDKFIAFSPPDSLTLIPVPAGMMPLSVVSESRRTWNGA